MHANTNTDRSIDRPPSTPWPGRAPGPFEPNLEPATVNYQRAHPWPAVPRAFHRQTGNYTLLSRPRRMAGTSRIHAPRERSNLKVPLAPTHPLGTYCMPMPCGEQHQTAEHVFLECPIHDEARRRNLQRTGTSPHTQPAFRQPIAVC